MVTPRSSNRTDRLARDIEASNTQRGNARASSGRSRRRFVPHDDSSDDDSDDDDYYRKEDAEYDDPSDELARQVREVSETERLNSTPRLELATHRPLAQIKAFSGHRSEHAGDYLNRLNGYARNAGVQFEKGGRESKEHVNRFLESCGDRGLERRLCHLRVKDIHALEDIINDILKSEERGSLEEEPLRTSPEGETALMVVTSGEQRPRGTDIDGTATTDTDADMTVEWMTPVTRPSLGDSSSEDAEDRLTDEGQSGSDYADPYHSDEHDSHVAAANDAERRTEAIGTCGRLKTAAVAETSPTEGSTATPATKALTGVVVSMDRVRHAGVLTTPPTTVSSVPSLQRRFKLGSPPTETGLVPIGLPQLASPPVDAECVYAFVGERKWLKTQRREEVNEVNTTEIEKEINGSFGGGENDERKTEEWNSGGSEGLVSSVTKKNLA
ncbi:unnamed protein product [Phytophthora fragariaefolia]|uniref:Unnamed protein product n=1 Tax=Phytophthora fragariaefolia TaxID=1490495 RepID=A0A9W6Y0T0_9STRA|nr:unnamed protein product [Phytophthora fragariaefolia]